MSLNCGKNVSCLNFTRKTPPMFINVKQINPVNYNFYLLEIFDLINSDFNKLLVKIGNKYILISL